MRREDFIRRLREAHRTYFSERVPSMDGTRVYAVGADEIWSVDFLDDGTMGAEAYRLASEEPITDPSALESLCGYELFIGVKR